MPGPALILNGSLSSNILISRCGSLRPRSNSSFTNLLKSSGRLLNHGIACCSLSLEQLIARAYSIICGLLLWIATAAVTTGCTGACVFTMRCIIGWSILGCLLVSDLMVTTPNNTTPNKRSINAIITCKILHLKPPVPAPPLLLLLPIPPPLLLLMEIRNVVSLRQSARMISPMGNMP
jgi:hypothetical protein